MVYQRSNLIAKKWIRTYNQRGVVMEFEDVKSHFENNHRGVITTFQADGAGHSSIVVCGAYQGTAAFVIVRVNSDKARNLRRATR